MNLSEGHISYQTKGRYYVLGDFSEDKSLLVVLHGYGYLAKYFIQKFKNIDLSKFVILCPEAPHRFYQKGTNGRIGASWMTKEDRETDIENYVSFLDSLIHDIKSKNEFNKCILLGFSQGGATASRFLAYTNHQFEQFILWATVFPPDMPVIYFDKFSASKNYFVFGSQDEYYPPEKVKEHFEELKKLTLPFQMINFDGKHDIDATTLLKVLNE